MKKMKKTLKTVELKTLLTNFKSNEKFSRKGIVLVSYSVHDNVWDSGVSLVWNLGVVDPVSNLVVTVASNFPIIHPKQFLISQETFAIFQAKILMTFF